MSEGQRAKFDKAIECRGLSAQEIVWAWAGWQMCCVEQRAPDMALSSAGLTARPLSEYSDDHGSVVWWRFEGGKPLGEPARIGAPSDDDWPYPFDNKGEAEQYYTHWTPHPPMPVLGASAKGPAP